MLLKEKLAKEFTLLLDREVIDARDSSAKQRATDRAFIAGFDAAKKLMFEGEYSDAEDVGEEEYE